MNNNLISLDQATEIIKKDCEGLTEEQKELIAIYLIAKLGRLEDTYTGFKIYHYNEDAMSMEQLKWLAETANIDYTKLLIAFSFRDYNSKFMELYKDSLKHYYKVLDNYKNMAHDLGLDSSLELSSLLTYMLWNGYYSVNKEHIYTKKGNLFLPGMESFDVIKGGGVCIAYAELLNNYLTVCGKESTIISCNYPTKNSIKYDYRPKITRRINNDLISNIIYKINRLMRNNIINEKGNHEITLVHEKGKVYAFDPTNLSAINIKDSSTASIVNGTGEYPLKHLTTLMLNPNIDINQIYTKLMFNKPHQIITREDYINSFERVLELVNENISLINDAYDNIHNDLEFIDNQTEEIGGLFEATQLIKK